MVGGTLIHAHVHSFGKDGGVSGVAVFREGHVNVRSWPAEGLAACDVLFMGTDDSAELIVELLAQAFRSTGQKVTRCERKPSESVKTKSRRPRLIERERTQAAA